MTETKMLVYAGLGLLLLLRAIINNNIFNTINKTNYSIFEPAPIPSPDSLVRYFNNTFVFWYKIKEEYKTLAIISNILFLFIIALFIYSLVLWS
jgi:hypothetical protein